MVTAATVRANCLENGIEKLLVKTDATENQCAEQAVDNVHGSSG
jgi:hypothetical protein